MAIEEGIYAYLQTKTAVTTLVSTRIYPIMFPQDPTLPCIVFQKVSGSRQHEARGAVCVQGKVRSRYQFDCIAETPDGAKNLGEALRIALDGWIGLMGTNTVQSVSLIGDRDVYDPEVDFFIRSMDFLLVYLEATT